MLGFLQTKFALTRHAIFVLLMAFAVMVLASIAPMLAHAKGPVPNVKADTVLFAALPKQAHDTYAKILTGGPFDYDKDGTVFGNRERILPAQKRGFYREYTVKTPYARNRGAKRIVCGGSKASAPEACYYTDDHYASFKRIVK